jgi:hypothetical protein
VGMCVVQVFSFCDPERTLDRLHAKAKQTDAPCFRSDSPPPPPAECPDNGMPCAEAAAGGGVPSPSGSATATTRKPSVELSTATAEITSAEQTVPDAEACRPSEVCGHNLWHHQPTEHHIVMSNGNERAIPSPALPWARLLA